MLDLGQSGAIQKTIRMYRQIDFRRQVGNIPQLSTLRPEVRRLVLLRKGLLKVPFSPDGPLTWGEIDLVRTDVFTPALAGLLPTGPVAVGARWKAADSAVRELTDLARIDDGGLDCRLEQVVSLGGRRLGALPLRARSAASTKTVPTGKAWTAISSSTWARNRSATCPSRESMRCLTRLARPRAQFAVSSF